MQENNSIGYHIFNTEKLIGRYIFDKFNKKARHRISPMQVMIMKYLLKNQERSVFQQDICDTFNLRRSTVSGILTTMEKNGILIRKVASEDPRKNEIKLTEVFLSNTKKISLELINLESILEQNFTLEEKEELIRLLKKLTGNLIKEERKKNV